MVFKPSLINFLLRFFTAVEKLSHIIFFMTVLKLSQKTVAKIFVTVRNRDKYIYHGIICDGAKTDTNSICDGFQTFCDSFIVAVKSHFSCSDASIV